MPVLNHNAYTVGWICALPDTELPAAVGMLDEEHDPLNKHPADSNTYEFGRIGMHNVVIACLPAGRYGTSSAAHVATNMIRSFPAIKIRLMVGIGGGLPNSKQDVRLGDVVVSQPTSRHGGVVQYDMGKARDGNNFELRGHLDSPPLGLLTAVSKLRGRHVRKDPEFVQHLAQMLERSPRMASTFARPGGASDVLSADIARQLGKPNGCERQPRNEPQPHYGLIASGNKVVASVEEALRIEKLVGDQVLCFEMEAAGLMKQFQCVVIRGIGAYADSLKNDDWQPYAAATAAAYAKELLNIVPAETAAHSSTNTANALGVGDVEITTPRSPPSRISQGPNTFGDTNATGGREIKETLATSTFLRLTRS